MSNSASKSERELKEMESLLHQINRDPMKYAVSSKFVEFVLEESSTFLDQKQLDFLVNHFMNNNSVWDNFNDGLSQAVIALITKDKERVLQNS